VKAVFLDRDGVINELVYYHEQGIIDSPFTAEKFRLLPRVGEAIRRLQEIRYKVILVSNQPGIAKGYLSWETFEEIRQKMKEELAKEGVYLDKEYYCFHHPEAKIGSLKVDCECRKPKPGMLLQAAADIGLDLSGSWLIGDNLCDIEAGKTAGCKTILLGKMKCELCRFMDEKGTRPNLICPNLMEASWAIINKGYTAQESGELLCKEI
jgi:histidinol-phosphate phosphatase family protein